ncbi:MAG: hypothetical protein WCK36_02895 [Candidatus Firestonebacteria bacterium]
MRKRSGQAITEYILIIALLLAAFSGVFIVFSKTLHSHWNVYSKIIAGPLP